MRLLVILLLAISACTSAPSPSAGVGITRDDAIRIANEHLPAPGELVSATLGNRAGFVPADSALINTWIVRFTGDFPIECPAPPAGDPRPSCPDLHGVTVLIDRFTGEFVSAQYG